MDFGTKGKLAVIAGGDSGISQATAELLTIDIFVNCVGIPGAMGGCLELSDDPWQEMLGVER